MSSSSASKDDRRSRQPLREDVRLLGSLWGDTIDDLRATSSSTSWSVFDCFPTIHTEPSAERKRELFDLVESLDAHCRQGNQSLSHLFDLIIAEQNHRVRRRTQRDMSPETNPS